MSSAWSGDWKARIVDRVGHLGFESVSEYVNERPGTSFGDMAKELGQEVPHMQLQRLYLEGCVAQGCFMVAAAECLARTIVERFRKGWGKGVRLDYQTASALAAWISDMQCRVEQSELDEGTLEQIATALRDTVSPPVGWLPANGRDPMIQRAFNIGLETDG